jgi:hypothetical protein
MPMHDWTRVDAGIYHAFHHNWITAISMSLNSGLLPEEFYALPEQHIGDFGPDVLTLKGGGFEGSDSGGVTTLTKSRPQTRVHSETADAFYRRKQKSIAIRHVSGDELVAVIEIVSPGNKSSRSRFEDFLRKAWALFEQRIHLLVLDPFPPGPRDPDGVHAAIWDVPGDPFKLPADQPLTFASYECNGSTHAYIETLAVGDSLPPMPVFVEPGGHVTIPLEATYQSAWSSVPARWRRVIEPAT